MARAIKVMEKHGAILRDKTIMSLSYFHFNAGEMPRGGNKMLKGCRYFLLLAAFMVGLGVLGGANEVGAAQVTKVSIATPDSGELRGIDSLITAKVEVFDVPTTDDLTVVMYLVTTGSDTVVTERNAVINRVTFNNNKVDKVIELREDPADTDAPALDATIDADLITDLAELLGDVRIAASSAASPGRTSDLFDLTRNPRPAGGTPTAIDLSPTTGGLVAVKKVKNNLDDEDAIPDVAATTFIGNADSVTTRSIPNGTEFTWHVKVSPQLATSKLVRVAAFTVVETDTDPANNVVGDVKISPASEQFTVDGDRPKNPSDVKAFNNADFSVNEVEIVTPAQDPDGTPGSGDEVAAVTSQVVSPDEGTLVASADGTGATATGTDFDYTDGVTDISDGIALTTRADNNAPGRYFGYLLPSQAVPVSGRDNIEGFAKGGQSKVLGIGDSLKLRLKLGAADATDVLEKGDLDVAAFIFGKRVDMDKNNRSGGSDVVKLDLLLEEGQFGTGAAGCCAGHNHSLYNHDPTVADDGTLTPSIAPTDTIRLVYVDKAGNLSGDIDGNMEGVFALADFFADTKKPALDALSKAAGDTILPVSNDTITDGTHNLGTSPFPTDSNTVVWRLAEPLDTLFITFDGARVDASFRIPNKSSSLNDVALQRDAEFLLDFTPLGDFPAGADDDSVKVLFEDPLDDDKVKLVGTGTAGIFKADDIKIEYKKVSSIKQNTDSLLTGVHTLKFQGQDMGGNMGPELARENVYVDVDELRFQRLFPTKAGFGKVTDDRLDTLEEETAKLSFSLSEPADSVLITYKGIDGPGEDSDPRTRRLSGSELTLTTPQLFAVDSLEHNTKYVLTVLGKDLSGHYTQAGPDTFLYDTTHAVPTIKQFAIKATAVQTVGEGDDAEDKDVAVGLLPEKQVVAGQKVTLTLVADATTDGSRNAVTYREEAILKVEVAGSDDGATTGIALEGNGVDDQGGGRALLSALDWVTGERIVTLTDTTAIETLMVSIVDSTSEDGPFAGRLDSSIVVNTGDFSQIAVSAPDTVTQGENFFVSVGLADKYANPRLGDNRYVSITANKLGVQVPTGDLLIKDGAGGFQVNSGTFAGAGLVITVRDIVAGTDDKGNRRPTGDDFADGQSAAIYVAMPGEVIVDEGGVDAPDTLIVEDYTGADGAGDQGGFLLLTWDLSDNHSPGSGGVYRIYREVSVNYDAPGEGDESGDSVVELDSPSMVALPWAKVDMIPAEDIGRAIVATLDNVATRWFIAAEIGAATSARGKHAFSDVSSFLSPDALMAETMVPGLASPAPIASAESPYELMTETMVASKQAGMVDPDAPVIATLTPEALEFAESGAALRLKGTETEVRSSDLTPSAEAVAAIDNIAPEPITYLRVMDTPGDAGASIDVLWTKSESDRLVPRSAAGAVGRGGVGDLVSGVVGYNVYRKAGNEELILVGSANAGETIFSDITALNGVRYTYQVSPFDNDNIAHSDLERTAMAIRNNVVDKSGSPIYGLFGPDQSVGFDDFFIFADFFGLDASSEDFDPAFDLSRNNKIDFDDFFVFADNFGRSVEAAGKAVPTLAAGLNPEASLFLEAAADLPRVGEEMVIDVGLADFAELKGYGFTVNFDSDRLEFVKVLGGAELLGGTELAQPHLVAQADGEISIAAFGQTVDKGELDMRLIFRPTMEIEDSRIYFSEGQLRDSNYGVNQVERLGEVQIQTRPEVFALADNYPNPFNPETTIKYALPEAVDVRLDIYNMLGQMVRTMVAENQSPGRYVVRWDATDNSGSDLSTGIYFYRLRAGEFLETKKMLLLK